MIYNNIKYKILFLFFFILTGCNSKNTNQIETIYHSNSSVREDYDLLNYDIILSDTKNIKDNLINNISEIQKNTNHYIVNKNFKLKKLNLYKNLQIIPERNIYINFSPIIYNDQIIINTDSNIIYCFDLKGKIIWSINLNKEIFKKKNQFMNYISIVNHKMIVHSSNGEIACFDLKNSDKTTLKPALLKPALIWHKDLQEKINSNLTIDDSSDKFYILTVNSNLYEFNLKGENIFSFKNKKENPNIYDFKSSSVFVDKNYIIFGDLNGELFCLNKNTKKLNWSIDINLIKQEESQVVFTGFTYNFIDNDKEIIIPSNLGLIISFDKSTGALKWVREITVGSEIIMNNNFLFFFDIYNTLIALRKNDSKIKWIKQFQLQQEYKLPRYLNDGNFKYFNIRYHSPVLVNDDIILTNYFGEMFQVSSNTGEVIEKKDIPYFINSALIFSNGIGYTSDFTGGIFKTETSSDKN